MLKNINKKIWQTSHKFLKSVLIWIKRIIKKFFNVYRPFFSSQNSCYFEKCTRRGERKDIKFHHLYGTWTNKRKFFMKKKLASCFAMVLKLLFFYSTCFCLQRRIKWDLFHISMSLEKNVQINTTYQSLMLLLLPTD